MRGRSLSLAVASLLTSACIGPTAPSLSEPASSPVDVPAESAPAVRGREPPLEMWGDEIAPPEDMSDEERDARMHKLAFEGPTAPAPPFPSTWESAARYIEGPLEQWHDRTTNEQKVLSYRLEFQRGDEQGSVFATLWQARMSRFIFLEYKRAIEASLPPLSDPNSGRDSLLRSELLRHTFERYFVSTYDNLNKYARSCASSEFAAEQVRNECNEMVRTLREFERDLLQRPDAIARSGVASDFIHRATQQDGECVYSGSITSFGTPMVSEQGYFVGTIYEAHLEEVHFAQKDRSIKARLTWPLVGSVSLTRAAFQMRTVAKFSQPGVMASIGDVIAIRAVDGVYATIAATVTTQNSDFAETSYTTTVNCDALELIHLGPTMSDGPQGSLRLHAPTGLYAEPGGDLIGYVGNWFTWLKVGKQKGDFSYVQSQTRIAPNFSGWMRSEAISYVSPAATTPPPKLHSATHISTRQTAVMFNKRAKTGLVLENSVPVIVLAERGQLSRVAIPGVSPNLNGSFWVERNALRQR